MITRRTLLAGMAAGPALPAARHARTAQAEVEKTKDVPFAVVDGQELLVDVYQPAPRAEPRPAIIFLHGGGLTVGYRHDMDWPASELAALGYVGFSFDYRLFNSLKEPHNRWPAQLDDAQRAVRWVRTNAAGYGVDPERVAAFGHSSGGYLAALLGTTETRDPNADPSLASFSSRVSCVVTLAGEADLTLPYRYEDDYTLMTGIYGGTAEEIPAVYREASPITHVDEATAPFLIAHGGRDDYVTMDQSWTMAAALHDAGIAFVYTEYPDTDHFEILNWTVHGPLAAAFLGQHLQPDR